MIAVVGVAGTLTSALLTQRSATRSKAMELEHAERENRLTQLLAEERRVEEMRRACYVSLNQLARRFHSVMFVYHRACKKGPPSEAQELALQEARVAYQGIYSEAQMLVPGLVMREAHATNASLMAVYELLKGTEHATPENPPEDLEGQLSSASRSLSLLRKSLRSDLGLDNF
ncbi:hypothetical protein ACIQOU_32915 [Streptomyces sp. NPDC091279]|uniref:hypothetical protein n=1 Tax=Streptomyces sp. NPDC091279 TaxID=3365983 RepID=UPI0037FFF6FA